jgi:hypothetical protein
VTTNETLGVPPGWYPDPSGEKQWRVWNGKEWSDLTRAYVAAMDAALLGMDQIRVLYGLRRYGIFSFFAGAGMMLGLLNYWPGSVHPLPWWFTNLYVAIGAALFILGYASFARAALALEEQPTVSAFIPLVNVVFVTLLCQHRLQNPFLRRVVVSEAILFVVALVGIGISPWLIVIPALLSAQHFFWTDLLLDRAG